MESELFRDMQMQTGEETWILDARQPVTYSVYMAVLLLGSQGDSQRSLFLQLKLSTWLLLMQLDKPLGCDYFLTTLTLGFLQI